MLDVRLNVDGGFKWKMTGNKSRKGHILLNREKSFKVRSTEAKKSKNNKISFVHKSIDVDRQCNVLSITKHQLKNSSSKCSQLIDSH